MGPVVFIGDEAACAGFRLAGVDARCPDPGEVDAVFTQALATASLVVLTRRCAGTLPPERLHRALPGETPLVFVMPDLTEPRADTGFVRRLRAVLGIEA